MKSAMPYHGVPMPAFRGIARRVFGQHPLATEAAWRDTVLELWRDATHREERYAAIELAGLPAYRIYADSLRSLDVYEEMITTGAWWDLVDGIAADRIGGLLRAHPREMRALLLRWSAGADPWRRRAAILAQLRFRGDTDWELLQACIEPSLGERSFWLRKAIGWALREYAKHEPDRVAAYLAERGDRLSGLSRSEAARGVEMSRRVSRPPAPAPRRAGRART